MDQRALHAFFAPRTVAVIGASATPGKIGHSVVANMLAAGFKGRLFPVNPKGGSIEGLSVVRSISELPGGIDLAVIAVPRDKVLPALEELAASGLKSAIVITAGFREVGREGHDLEQRMAELAKSHGIALLEVAGQIRELASSGPIREQAAKIEQVIHHPAATGVAVVAIPEDLAVSEAIEAVAALRARDLPVAAAVMNAVRASTVMPADEAPLRKVADSAAGDAERAAALAAIDTLVAARHDAAETESLVRGTDLPVVSLPDVPDLRPGSGGLERLAAALMADRRTGGGV